MSTPPPPPPSPPRPRDAVRAAVDRAADAWRDQLIDLGGRNTLLYYRDLKQGTLDLSPGTGADRAQTDSLLDSHIVRLSTVFGDQLPVAAKRARTVRAKAIENFEERGLRTLYLAWGMATWDNTHGKATPAAPIFLRQAHLQPRGSGEDDYDLNLIEEWEVNPALLYLLESEHQINVDPEVLIGLLAVSDGISQADESFYRLTHEAREVTGFSISERLVLGNFSYAKLPMVKDLEGSGDLLAANPLICAIAGDEESRQIIRERHPIVEPDEPDRIPPHDEFLVLDADASQSYVVNAVVKGGDLVVHGPPGTGKSQTIALLIASLSARGQRVLFVAEKRAAIDAVLDRLRKVGLGELVMDLHGSTRSKRKLAQDLSTSLADIANVAMPDMSAQQEILMRRRHELTARTAALHNLRSPWGISVYEAQSRLIDVPKEITTDQRLDPATLNAIDADAKPAVADTLRKFVDIGGVSLRHGRSPWLPAILAGTVTSADQAQQALSAAQVLATHSLPASTPRLWQAVAEVGLREPTSLNQWASVMALLRGIGSTLALFNPEIYSLALQELVSALAPCASGNATRFWARLSNAQFRRARKRLRSHFREQRLDGPALLTAVTAAAEQQRDWRAWTATSGDPRLPDQPVALDVLWGQIDREVRTVARWAAWGDVGSMSLSACHQRVQALLDDKDTLYRLPELQSLRASIAQRGLQPLLAEVESRNLTAVQALACFDHVWLSSIMDTVSIADPIIGAFDGEAHARTVREYRAADSRHIETASIRIRRAIAENATRVRDQFGAEAQVVATQAAKKRGGLPIRQLLEAAPHVLTALKPCWAMSPLVVSQVLPAQRCFDVAIFDEASQVTPPDAVGAIMRCERVVVAGDAHQLPPTSFFSTSGGGQDDEDDEDLTGSALTKDIESILDVMTALLPPPHGARTLRWHYRSRDERLIAFSNAQPTLYNWSLTTFPGITASGCLTSVLVPYEPGRAAQEESVTAEVDRVVALVKDHVVTHPDESLGVIAMGIKHSNRIAEALRLARREDDTLDAFMSRADEHRFFVKNLERVQGDERDAIIISVGYGKTADGRMLYQFGPINNVGGERRLNVAITRARSRLTLVSSFSSLDMDPNRLSSDGAKLLRSYIAYVESDGANLGRAAGTRPEINPFERDVRDQLTAAGIPLVCQFGSSGYFIDFAAQHPTQLGRMVLAIEADGAGYHSSSTARDRDRLRQEHLERLGWTFHRIWSSSWFLHREDEVAKAVAAYWRAVASCENGDGGGAVGDPALATDDPPPGPPSIPSRRGRQPVDGGRGSIGAYASYELTALIRWIDSDTLLRTADEVVSEAMRCLQLTRRTVKTLSHLHQATISARKRRTGSAGRPSQPSVRL